MNTHFQETILSATNATALFELEKIQSLWSGYGSIVRYGLKDSDYESVVVKHVKMPDGDGHPRGWDSDFSHQRKIKSYQVETTWYKNWAEKCGDGCRIPHCLALETYGDEVLMVMEDLDAAGFSRRCSTVTWNEISACLSWLANFHATYLAKAPEGLWDIGTYWHLDTRPDELEVMEDHALTMGAPMIDRKLNAARFLTFVHGDAKLANFCFSTDGKRVAAVDFQYVGGGCGMKDVAYFIGSCLYEDDCEKLEEKLLDFYFGELRQAVATHHSHISITELEEEWRVLYPLAWTDFHRFLKGWSPTHWKINSYSERLAREVLATL